MAKRIRKISQKKASSIESATAKIRVEGRLRPVTDFEFDLLDGMATEMERAAREDYPLHRSNNGRCIDVSAVRLENDARKLRAAIRKGADR